MSTSQSTALVCKPTEDSLVTKVILRVVQSLPFILGIHFGGMFICSLFFTLLETGYALPAEADFWSNLFDALYWANVTGTSTGYGDIAPKTKPGRLLAMVMVNMWIIFLVPMLVANFLSRIIRSKHQETHEEQEWNYEALERIAQQVGAELRPQPHDTEYGNVHGNGFRR